MDFLNMLKEEMIVHKHFALDKCVGSFQSPKHFNIAICIALLSRLSTHCSYVCVCMTRVNSFYIHIHTYICNKCSLYRHPIYTQRNEYYILIFLNRTSWPLLLVDGANQKIKNSPKKWKHIFYLAWYCLEQTLVS